MNLVARLHADHWTKPSAALRRMPHLIAAHRFDQSLLESLDDRADDNEALARDAALSPVDHSRGGGDLCRRANVGIFQYQISIGPAELEDALLEHRTGGGRDAFSRRHASGQSHAGDILVPDHRLDVAARQ